MIKFYSTYYTNIEKRSIFADIIKLNIDFQG